MSDLGVPTDRKPHTPHRTLQEPQPQLRLLKQHVAPTQLHLRREPLPTWQLQRELRDVESMSDFAEQMHQVWQLMSVRDDERFDGFGAHAWGDPVALARGAGEEVVAAADGVVDVGVVEGPAADVLHCIDEFEACWRWHLAGRALHAGTCLARVSGGNVYGFAGVCI